jgi:putative ABC transport system substrate-binding protein
MWPQPRRDWRTLLLLTCLLHLAALLFSHGAAAAESSPAPFRVALLDVRAASSYEALRDGILRKLESRGAPPGRVHIELFAKTPAVSMDDLTREVVAYSPQAILATTDGLAKELAKRIQDTPILFASIVDPVQFGLVDTLARGKGNCTGLTGYAPTFVKRWEILKTNFPQVKRIGVLVNPQFMPAGLPEAIPAASHALQVAIAIVPLPGRTDAAGLRQLLADARVDALEVPYTGRYALAIKREFVDTVTATRLPVIFDDAHLARLGGLLSYEAVEPDHAETFAELLQFVMHGVPPAEIPIRTPKGFALTVNMKTARRLGIVLPSSLIRQASEIIQ